MLIENVNRNAITLDAITLQDKMLIKIAYTII